MNPVTDLLGRGFALHQRGQSEEAERLYTEVLKIDPHQFDALHLLGLLKHGQGNNSEALSLVGAALNIKPDYADALLNYGSILAALERHEEAIVYFDRAMARNPSSARALNNRGNSLAELKRFDEALACFDQALAMDSNYVSCLVNRARMLRDIGRYAEAIPNYARALELQPGIADSNFIHAMRDCEMHLGLAELALGNFSSGWKLYESRFKKPTAPSPWLYSMPRWKGEYVKGRMVAWGEQGLGDEILFASLIPDLRRYADSVVLETEPRLKKLFARSFPEVDVVGRGESLNKDVVAQSPIGSLGQYLRPSWESFPRRDSGYLVPDRDFAARLRSRLCANGRAVIGLSWISKGNKFAEFKTARLSDFQSVLQLPGCRFIDLQYGDTLAERDALRNSTGIVVERLADIDNTNDIDGLAALITACDVIVTVSNTTAHLAGALGKPTMLFVQHTGRNWYWFTERPDSPWYPRLRVNRQVPGQPWKDLIALGTGQVAAAVKAPGT
jgi:Tfp pilus assembly protein PilF